MYPNVHSRTIYDSQDNKSNISAHQQIVGQLIFISISYKCVYI